MKTIEIRMELPTPPDGWRYTGEYRVPSKGESFFTARTTHPQRMVSHGYSANRQFILEKDSNAMYGDSFYTE